MALVLCISADKALATTRQAILEKAGHRVVTAFTVQEVERACREQPIDVAVIGQAVPARERLRIHQLVRAQCPTAKILELYLPSIGRTLPEADDAMLVPSDTPAELAQRVSALAGERQR